MIFIVSEYYMVVHLSLYTMYNKLDNNYDNTDRIPQRNMV